MIVPAQIEVILLAAGHSRRMAGVDKLLLPLPGGTSLLAHSAGLYRALGMPLLAVLRPDRPEHRAALAGLDLRIATNPDPAANQSGSIRTGLAAATLDGAGVLIALADQPWLTGADIAALIATFAAHDGQRIVVPRHHGQRGNPVLLPTATARALCDEPAATPRALIDARPEQVAWHEAATDHFTRDVDTPADAALLAESPR
ncbi:MAG: nucleotidyltransferase family protein [Proteobacteria bacterium]|nr:nucleotidyltransferase family protein [Pseudomonadota bacterium]